MSQIDRYSRVSLCLLMLSLLFLSPAVAQEDPRNVVRKSLVHLDLSGTPQEGPSASIRGGVKSQGTGFFVSSDGYILTTRHIFTPLQQVRAVNTVIEARISDTASLPFKVQFVSDLQTLDLVLLKANLPFGTESTALDIGSSVLVDETFKSEPKLLTSGFQDDDYKHNLALLNDRKSNDVPYAWTIKVKTVSGQSGSPVYIESDSGIKVVGIIKATSKQDDELTLMTPIEFSMPLIGHLKFQELSDTVEKLSNRVDNLIFAIGEMSAEDPPIQDRIQDIEGQVAEVESHFTWHAETQSDGSLLVSYEKIISGGLQVDHIYVNITPNMRFFVGNGDKTIFTSPIPELRLPNNGLFERVVLDTESGRGEFIIQDVEGKLTTSVELAARAVGYPEPYRDLEISLVPVIEGQNLSLKKLTIFPEYNWDLLRNTELASN